MQVTGHKQGQPNWAELMTTDENAALAFYNALFGWQDRAEPIPDDGVYHMQMFEDAPVAAIGAQNEEERTRGVPPRWAVYLAVNDVDAVVSRVEGAGGGVLLPPMDVMELGRMAVINDPTGAVVSLWQERAHRGFGRVREPGTWTWSELITDDPERAAQFYSAILDVPAKVMDMGPDAEPYTLLGPDQEEGAGIARKQPEMGRMPNVWAIYFEVADTDTSAARARELGATVLSEPMDMLSEPTDSMPGRFAMLQDPQGAVFGIIKSAPVPQA